MLLTKFKDIAQSLLYCIGVAKFADFVNKHNRNVSILMYHSIIEDNQDNKTNSCLDLIGMAVSKDTFETQIEYISKKYTVISIDEYIKLRINNCENITTNYVIVTFDDGFMDNYTTALPVLIKYNMPASFNIIGNAISQHGEVVTHKLYFLLDRLENIEIRINLSENIAFIGKYSNNTAKKKVMKELSCLLNTCDSQQRTIFFNQLAACLPPDLQKDGKNYKALYMTKEHLLSLHRKGFAVGGHSMAHRNFATLQGNDKEHEIVMSRRLLDDLFGPAGGESFAYPFGQRDHFDEEVKKYLRQNRFRCGLTTIEGVNSPKADLFELKRIEIGEFAIPRFALHLTGVVGFAKFCLKRVLGRRH